jgi:hypothetical protein
MRCHCGFEPGEKQNCPHTISGWCDFLLLLAERDRLRSALRHLVNHWDEFGAEYGLDESFHLARRALEEGK